MDETIRVAVGLDVEEEGLFRGCYACHSLPIANLAALPLLNPLIRRGVKLTLFCAFAALGSDAGRSLLDPLAPFVEIGAHLHHWNTPPLTAEAEKTDFLRSVPASSLPPELMEAKLSYLLELGKSYTGKPLTSFRMGKWDLHKWMLPILARQGIKTDASIRPLHDFAPLGPNHFDAPANPYVIHTPHGDITEIPLTVTPLAKALTRLPRIMRLPRWGALALLPVEHPLWLMQLTTLLHISRGGAAISLAWHSSEMHPGGNPRLATVRAVRAFLAKISAYLDWLEKRWNIVYTFMGDMPAAAAPMPVQACDWTCAAKGH